MKLYLSVLLILCSCLLWGQEQSNIHDNEPYLVTSVYFAGGRYYIDFEQRQDVATFLEDVIIENYEIHIHSHTDNIGGVEYNEWLSQMRSEAARQMLQELGIPLDQLFIKDHGLFNPMFDNSTWEGRRKNRRVDIVLWPLPA